MSGGNMTREELSEARRKPVPIQPDYYEVQYLKRGDDQGWTPHTVYHPTKESADEYAAKLALGNQASIRVVGRSWS